MVERPLSDGIVRGLAPLLVLAGVLVGCGKPEPPPRVPATGTVSIGGKPVPSALVTFYPLFEGFGGELIAEGVTDGQGRFSLAGPLGEGACVGRHKVTVTDAPSPNEAREQSVEGQRRMQEFLRSLTNRPIGEQFGSLATTPLEVEITPAGGPYDLKLTH